MSLTSIWCLFSVDNNYDQPANNLVAFWPERPSIEALAKFLGYNLAQANDDTVVALVDVWKGKGASVAPSDTEFRLEEVQAGQRL